MKWIKVVDLDADLNLKHFGQGTQARLVYDTVKKLSDSQGFLGNIEKLKEAVADLCRTGALKTKQPPTGVAADCLSKLKRRGYVVTEKPFAPRRYYHQYYGVAYVFCETDREKQLPKGAAWIFQKYKGRTMQEWELWMELIDLPSPTGRRTMWHYFKYYRSCLICFGIVKEVRMDDPTDPIFKLQFKARLEELRAKDK